MKISISKGEEFSEETAAWAQGWTDYEEDNQAEIDNIPNEIKKRTSSYSSAYEYNLEKANEMIYFVLPFFFISGCSNDDGNWHGIVQAWGFRWRTRY